MECPYCREQMHDEASVCPHCRREHPKAQEARRQHWGKVAGISAAVLVGGFVLIMIAGAVIGNDPHAFDGSNHKVYEAVRLYGAGLTEAEADKLVFDVAQHASLSHSEAEDIVVSCVKIHMTDVEYCGKFADTVKAYTKLKKDGVVD